jgi:hypothetical protein
MEELARGKLDGTAIDHNGYLRLAPSFQTIWGPEPGVVWAVAPAGPGEVFAALSGPGRVLRLKPSRDPERWYEAGEDVWVTAVAGAGRKGAYFGLSPLGQVLHAPRPGEHRVVLESGSQFVWALLGGPGGVLWVGTGAPGRLIRLQPDGASSTVFDSEQDPIRCLAELPSGGIVAGTGAQGRVIRFAADGRPFVLLDAEEEEIVALSVGADGAVLAAAAGGGAAPAAPRQEGADAEEPADLSATVGVKAEEPSGRAEEPPRVPVGKVERPGPKGAGGSLYEIDPAGGSVRIWKSETDTPYALVAVGENRILVAAGEAGQMLELDRRGQGSRLLRFPSDQVSALAVAPDGQVLIGAARDARVALLGPKPSIRGSYLSEPVDAGGVADWGRLRWEGDVPSGARVELALRSGNTDQPDGTWSDWAATLGTDSTEGAVSGVPLARWFQLRVLLTPSTDGRSPVVRRVELAYRPRNHPPEIRDLRVEPVGVAWVRPPRQAQNPVGPMIAEDPVSRRVAEGLGPPRGAAPVRKFYEAGARTFSWKAEDPDGDELSYDLEIRREGESHWFPLARGVSDEFFSWDSRAMRDGLHRVRLTADDRSGNADGRHFQRDRMSEPFRIDNTPPLLAELAFRRLGQRYEVTFSARDPHGRVEAVEYALDGHDWRPLSPVDGVADSDVERYRIEIPLGELPAGDGHLMLRVTDASGNLGGDMRILEVETDDLPAAR